MILKEEEILQIHIKLLNLAPRIRRLLTRSSYGDKFSTILEFYNPETHKQKVKLQAKGWSLLSIVVNNNPKSNIFVW
jgi:hypothetical protein